MSEHRREDRLGKALRDWDPAERFGSPGPATKARWRRALRAPEQPARRHGNARLRLAWTVCALVLAALAGLAVLRDGTRWSNSRGDEAAYVGARPLRLEFRASNGTRIYWVVQPVRSAAPDTGGSDDAR